MKQQDKLIVGLLMAAIVVSLVGALVSLNKIGEMKVAITGGAATSSTGTANLTISAQTEITNQNESINWGTGYVNGSHTNCTMTSEGEMEGCIDFTNQSNGFLLENTGNYNISVNYTVDLAAAGFIGGSNPDPEFQIRVMNNSVAQQGDDSSVDTVASCLGSGGWNISSYTNVTTDGDWLCGNLTTYSLSPSNDQDAGVVHIRVLIPANAGQGAKGVNFTFGAGSSG